MSGNRNFLRDIITSDSLQRESVHDRRFVDEVKIFSRQDLKEPSEEQLKQLTHIQRTVTMGDKMYKFSHEYYGSVDYWWVIAWYNRKPTDAHFYLGDDIFIPFPLERAISIATKED